METTILFAPLIGALICGFCWKLIGEMAAQWSATLLVYLASALSWILLINHDGSVETTQILRWIESGTLSSDWAIRIDRLSAVMLVVVTTISALVHFYSFGFKAPEDRLPKAGSYRPRLFAYLSLLTFAMLMLVTADNLIQLFFGWQAVGFATFLLIGFYYRKPSANKAAVKSVVVNRVGDAALLLGVVATYWLTDSLRFEDMFAVLPDLAASRIAFLWGDWTAANLLGVLLVIAAMAKSAQIFLHTWLSDTVETPAPAVALIQTVATTAVGLFLICRMAPLIDVAPAAQQMLLIVGAVTAACASAIAIAQNDIKRVLVFSTCSQLGFMFVAVGIGASSIAIFHLTTHAFAKATLILGAGSVIQTMQNGRDIQKYGALWRRMPWTFSAMLIATLALTGVGVPLTSIGFAEFASTAAIMQNTFASSNTFVFWLLIVAVVLTGIYAWRLLFLTFFGDARCEKGMQEEARDGSFLALAALAFLAVGATYAGMIGYGAEKGLLQIADDVPNWVKLSPIVATFFGFVLAFWAYIQRPELPEKLVAQFPAPQRLLFNRFYFDEIYDALIVRPMTSLSNLLWRSIDVGAIDRGLDGLAKSAVPQIARLSDRFQAGGTLVYVLGVVVGVAVLLLLVTTGGGAN